MPEEQQIRLVRRLWDAVGESGLEAGVELTEPDVEWTPHTAQGRVLTTRQLLDFFEEVGGARVVAARLYSVTAEAADTVLASGSLRLKGEGGISEFQIHVVYEFEGDRLVRVGTHATRSDALEAITRLAAGG